MTCVMENTLVSTTVERKKRGRYGIRVIKGQEWSKEYPGMIDCGDGIFRRPILWKGGSHNRYYIQTACSQCSKVILQDKNNSTKHKNAFCSLECKKTHIQAKSAGNRCRKKREHGQGSHILVRVHDHPRSGPHNQVYEHILVAENKLGRFLDPIERVHHINCVKDDNRPENLFVCANNTEHFRIHGSLNSCVAELISRGSLIFDEASKTYQVKK